MPDKKRPSIPGLRKDESAAKLLFHGNLLEENLYPFPKVSAGEAETLQMVLESIDRFAEGKEAEFREHDRAGVQPEEFIESLKELGLFGVIIPEDHGGIGLSNLAYSRVIQQTSRHDASTSLTVGAHSSIGMKGLLLFGTPEQKTKYLPRLASGEMIAAFCLTEPGSGSDAASIKTNAVENTDGSWTLNGEKIWITNGAFADFFTVFARTGSEEGKLTALIVERDFPGVSNGPKEDKMGIRGSATTSVRFENTRVPAENVLGEVGKGFKVAMSILNNGRTGLGGGCVGAMKRMILAASKQALERKQFGRPIAEYGLIKEKVAQMAIDCFAAESVVAMVGYYIDAGVEDYSIEAAMSKVFATEALWHTADEALQIAGGNGFMREYPYEQLIRDCRINRIFEGTNEILRLYIGLSGMKDVGEELKEIGKKAGKIFNDPIKGFGVLSGYASRRFTQLTSVGRDRIAFVPEELRDVATAFEHYTVKLSSTIDATLKRLGKNIVGSQLITKRVADSAIDLFVGLCVMSRVSTMVAEKGKQGCAWEISLARMFAKQCCRRISANLRRIEKNEDEELLKFADSIFKDGYRWDIF